MNLSLKTTYAIRVNLFSVTSRMKNVKIGISRLSVPCHQQAVAKK
jgi:hypothetical protein